MLLNLHVKNIALIDDVEIDFDKGLNILTGETGAGKSLIIDSVNFALGKRMRSDIVRDESEYALCELTFDADGEEVREKLKELDLPDEDGRVVMQRKVMKGRNIIRINGESASAAALKELSGVLIDIHGQHEHQSLLYTKKHREILDSYCGDGLKKILDKVGETYREYDKVSRELEEARNSEGSNDKEVAFAQFEVDEIMNAGVKEGEAAVLESEYRRLSNSKRIAEAVSYAHRYSGYDDESSAGASVGRALMKLKDVSEYDDELGTLINELNDIDALLNDFNRSIAAYEEGIDVSGERFGEVEERLNVVNRIMSRYGDSVDKIYEYLAGRQEFIDKHRDYEAYLAGLEDKHDKIRSELIKLCREASGIRSAEAAGLSAKIRDALKDLNFNDVRFEICVEFNEDNLGPLGGDRVEFLISTNPGEEIRPLSEVASGGELSRIMLALKSVLADEDSVGTLIFDEIDTGISGRTAQKVSEKLKRLSQKRQVICITHLPQIAAMADEHYEISKKVEDNRSITEVRCLGDEDSVNELARMLGGVKITDSVLNNAREMKALARNLGEI